MFTRTPKDGFEFSLNSSWWCSSENVFFFATYYVWQVWLLSDRYNYTSDGDDRYLAVLSRCCLYLSTYIIWFLMCFNSSQCRIFLSYILTISYGVQISSLFSWLVQLIFSFGASLYLQYLSIWICLKVLYVVSSPVSVPFACHQYELKLLRRINETLK